MIPSRIAGFTLLLALAPAFAATDQQALCQLFGKQQWRHQGLQTMDGCLRLIDAQAETATGDAHLKFGAWGDVLLAADDSLYYRSDNGGGHWNPIGSKSAAQVAQKSPLPPAPVASAPPATPAAAIPPPAAPNVSLATVAPPAAAASPAASTPIRKSVEAGREAPKPVPSVPPPPRVAPGAPAISPAESMPPAATGLAASGHDPYAFLKTDRRALDACQVRTQNGHLKQSGQTLDQCATSLETRGTPDPDGKFRAYWGKVYLSMDEAGIYVSNNGATRIKLRERR